MPDYPHIQQYYQDKQRLIDYGGSDNEQSIRSAFQTCLASYCRAHWEDLEVVAELRAPGGVIPDGTIKDRMRLTHGYWEAKDPRDNLDAEIQNKLSRGYSDENILFENAREAVLLQRGGVAMRVNMGDRAQLHRIIERFLDFVPREVEEFRQAWFQFKKDLPDILSALRAAITSAAAEDHYQSAAAGFLELCHRTIGPQVSEFDVQEMLIQHILTKDIFLRVFSEDQFHQENNIARQLDALSQTFFTGSLRRETVGELLPYYGAITAAAANIADYREKQRFIKAVYEDFYKTYNPVAAESLGVFYTPIEVVDFIIRGADYLLQKHFGRTLADDNVQILDPATGTGTFVTSLIDYLPPARLEYKYLNEIHANEVAILPYYIANLNIEYSYREKTKRYLEFPNLCFVDTLDNLAWQESGATGSVAPRQPGLILGALSEENWIRVQEQNEKPISVIIGNPPYNAAQISFNDFSPNRQYPDVDRRIRETYSGASAAQNRNQQYDMYKRFIRWASDRLADDGIIAFVNNSAFLDARQDDGFRKIVAEEFSELWAIDLKGNARTSGERRKREGGNIFENKIRVGVVIYFLVRRQGANGFRLFYHAIGDYLKSPEKAGYIRNKKLTDFDFEEIAIDHKYNWINQPDSDFGSLMPIVSPETKATKKAADERAVFKLYSNGVKTQRDDWALDYDKSHLESKIRFFAEIYEGKRQLLAGQDFDDSELGTEIKWDHELRKHLYKDVPVQYSDAHIVPSLYRPFTPKYLYFLRELNGRQYQMPRIFPDGKPGQNLVICFSGVASNKPFSALATNQLFSLDLLEKTQCLPLYRYDQDGKRVSNITKWAIERINAHYREAWGEEEYERIAGKHGLTAEDIFAYTYAVLHDPEYREEYEIDLLRELPRLPLYDNFTVWAMMGQKLLDLHTGFESAEPYPLERVDLPKRNNKTILKADEKLGAIIIDSSTTLTGIPDSAWKYRLGNRSALEWVLDQYKERKPRDATIAEKFNTYRFADYKEQVIDLLRRVCAISVRTAEIVFQDMADHSDKDPDEGLKFDPAFVAELQESIDARAAGEPTIPWEEVKRQLGL